MSVPETRQGTKVDPDSEITAHVVLSEPVQNLNIHSKKATRRAREGKIYGKHFHIMN